MRRKKRRTTNIKHTAQTNTPEFQFANKKSCVGKFFMGVLTGAALIALSFFVYNLDWDIKDKEIQTASADSADFEQEPEVRESQEQIVYEFEERKTTVEILNGCGENGVAKIFAAIIRDKGFDVLNTANFIENGSVNFDVGRSFIVDNVKKVSDARELAEDVGISKDLVKSINHPSPVYDITVVIGKDFRKLSGFINFSN